MAIKTAEEKYQAKQRRRRGLQKTRFYCQVCERQCLDENGFKCHVQSEIHMKNLKTQLETHGGSSRGVVNDYSDKFIKDFVSLLKKSHGSKMIGANRFYQEYIKNKDHIHLNSTKWRLLVHVISYMKDENILKVVESNGVNDEQFHIGYIDNSPEAIKRRLREQMAPFDDASRKGSDMDPELEIQIQRAEELKAQMPTRDPKTAITLTNPAKVKKKLSFGLKSKLSAKGNKGGVKSTGLN